MDVDGKIILQSRLVGLVVEETSTLAQNSRSVNCGAAISVSVQDGAYQRCSIASISCDEEKAYPYFGLVRDLCCVTMLSTRFAAPFDYEDDIQAHGGRSS